MNALPAVRTDHPSPFSWAMAGALTATTLDLAVAAAYWELHDHSTMRMLQSIAAYWGWGRGAYDGGIAMALLGATLFFVRMIVLAVAYQAAARSYAVLIEQPYRCGALFGLSVYLVNQYVVLPLVDSMPAPAMSLSWTVCCIVAHVALIGVPLALSARAAVRND
jgi:hypothetical protein